MNVRNPIADKVLDRFQSANGQIFSVADFLDLGPRPTVDQALSRLARQGKISRVRRAYMSCHGSANCLIDLWRNRQMRSRAHGLERMDCESFRLVRTLRIYWDSLPKSRQRLLITQTDERKRLR